MPDAPPTPIPAWVPPGCGCLVLALSLVLGVVVGGIGWVVAVAALNPAGHAETLRGHPARALVTGLCTGGILLWLVGGIHVFRKTLTRNVLRALAVLFLLLPLVRIVRDPWTPILPGADGIDESYAGRFKDDPFYTDLRKALPTERRRLLARTGERLGLEPPPEETVLVGFRDCTPWDSATASQDTAWTLRGYRPVITLYLDRLRSGVDSLQSELGHETVHVVLRHHLPLERQDTVAAWFREGLAVWASDGQTQVLTRLVSALAWERKRDASLGDGLEVGAQDLTDYLEAGFFFLWLSTTRGDETVRDLVHRVVEGATAREGVEAVTGLGFEETQVHSRDWSATRLRAFLEAQGYPDFVRAQDLLDRSGRDVAPMEAFLAAFPDSFLVPTGYAWIGRLEASNERWEACADAWRHARDAPQPGPATASAPWFEGLCREKAGDPAAARALWAEQVHGYGFAPAEVLEAARQRRAEGP